MTLGIKLWRKYGDKMTRSQFKVELGDYVHLFSRCEPDPDPPSIQDLSVWWAHGGTYPLGYFDNQGKSYTILEDRCP